MPNPIYTGPRQTISVKTAPATQDKPATFKDVELIPGKPLTIDPQSALFASLQAAGFVGESETAKAPAQPKAQSKPSSSEKE